MFLLLHKTLNDWQFENIKSRATVNLLFNYYYYLSLFYISQANTTMNTHNAQSSHPIKNEMIKWHTVQWLVIIQFAFESIIHIFDSIGWNIDLPCAMCVYAMCHTRRERWLESCYSGWSRVTFCGWYLFRLGYRFALVSDQYKNKCDSWDKYWSQMLNYLSLFVYRFRLTIGYG